MANLITATVEAVIKIDAKIIELLDRLDAWVQDSLDALASGNGEANESKKLAQSVQPAGSPVAPCPYAKNTETPCDVETIRLTDTESKTEVFTSLPRSKRKSVINPNLPEEKLSDMASYDLVMEIVADFQAYGKISKDVKPANVLCVVTHFGACPLTTHPLIRFLPKIVGSYDDDRPAHWQGSKSSTLTIYSSSQDEDVSTKSKSELSSLWPFGNPVKECTFTSESCGVRRGSSKVKSYYTALLRVYRNDKFELSISTPPLFKGTGSREAGGAKRTTEITEGDNSTKTTTERQVDGSRRVAESEISTKEATGKVMGKTVTTTKKFDPSGNVVSSEEITKREIVPVFTVKRNGSELAVTKVINQVMFLIDNIKKLSNILELLKMVPKIGFSGSFSISFFEGNISGEWGYRRVAVLDTAEYKWVERYLDVTMSIYLFRLSLSGFGGVEVKSPEILNWAEGELLEFTIGVRAELTLDVKLQETFALKGEADSEKQETVYAEGAFKLYGQGVACYRGYRNEVQAGVAGSAKFKGIILVGFSSAIVLTGQAEHDDLVLYAFWSGPGKRKRSPPLELKMLDKNESWGPPVAWNIMLPTIV